MSAIKNVQMIKFANFSQKNIDKKTASENVNHLVVFICRLLFISYYKLHSILLNRMNAISTFIIPINIIFIIKPEPFLNYFKKPICFWWIAL